MVTDGANQSTNGDRTGPVVSSVEDFLSHSYDYVICGGGTAGLTLAARLTENPDVSVAVLEAGKHRRDDPLVDTPGALFSLLGNPEYDWMVHSTPQKGNKDAIHHIPRGKLLGGSSGINYMMYVRGSDADYDDWAAITGDEGWSSKVMKQYMRKHQTLEPMDPAIIDRTTMPFVGENHGTSGPVRTSFNDVPPMPIETALINACDEVTGYNKKPVDPWSGDHIGFYNTLGSVVRSGPNKGKRSYAARGYLGMAADRPNLKILCEALVNKINLDGTKATAVNFTYSSRQYNVSVKRDVIVAGGVIKSPQILELSGIGDPEVLKAAGVEPKIDNPEVGNHLQDHVMVGHGYNLKSGVMSLDSLYQPGVLEAVQKQYMETQGGPLSCIASTQGFFPYKIFATPEQLKQTVDSIKESIKDAKTEFEKRQYEQVIAHLESDKSANLQMVMIPATANWETGVQDQAKIFPPRDPSLPTGATWVLCLQYPASRGSIHIHNTDPNASPVIDPGYLNHPADLSVLAAGLQLLDRISESNHIKNLYAERTHPDPKKYDLKDYAQAEAAVRDWCMGEYHVCGSVPMGAALDARLKVKGAENIRVIDASAFPNNVSGNICSSVYALAEKGADLIKEDWEYGALKAK